MPALQAENFLDLVTDTLKDLDKPKITDISSDLQDHPAAQELLKENRVTLTSGVGAQWTLNVNQTGAARNVGIGQSDNVNQVDTQVNASVPWRNSQTSWMVIGQQLAMNREPARIVDFVHMERTKGLISFVELLETNFWQAVSASDTLAPYGLPYYVTKNATKGFTGGTLSGFSTVAGLSPTTYTRWNNWAAPYTAVAVDDFIRQAREAATKTKFKPVVQGIPTAQRGSSRYGMYTNYAVIQPLEESLTAQNDSLGPDIASMDGKVMFRRGQVTWVPWLERDSTNPFYILDWSWLGVYVLEGWWAKETAVPITPGQHTVASFFQDYTYQFICKNRRAQAVVSNGTTYPS